jgi:hypothetical protein
MLPGKKKILALFVVYLIVATCLFGQSQKSYIHHFEQNLSDSSFYYDNQSLTFNYSISELNIEEFTNNYGDFYKILVPGHISTPDPGKPGVPVLSRLITIPENSTCTIKITNVKSEIIKPSDYGFKGVLFPAQVAVTKAADKQQQGFIINNSLYESKELISSDTVLIELVGKVRNKQLATFSVYPVRYNPFRNEIEVITSMKIEVSFSNQKTIQPDLPLKSAAIDELLSKGALNYNPDEVINGYSEHPVRIIILTDTTFKKFIQPLVKWKKQKGYNLDILYRGIKYAGVTYDEIKATIKNIYLSATTDNPAPEYLLIIGDINKIPRAGGTSNLTDMYYGEFDGGGDYIPELLIGRLPAIDTTEVKSVVSKIIQYEKFAFDTINSFYKKALATAGNDASKDIYMNRQVRYAVSSYLNTGNNISNYHFLYPKSASAEDSIKKLINQGLGFINFSGHGDASGWVSPAVNVSDIAAFSNKNMYPFIISNACRTAQFNVVPNFGANLVTSNENGAIGFIGCTNDSYWDEDYYWFVGFGNPLKDTTYATTGPGALDRLFHTHGESPSEWYTTMGQINFAGNLAVSSSTSNFKKYYWETYNLLGDPTVVPIIGKPGLFNIIIPDTLPKGIRAVSLSSDPQSYIGISDFDTLWDASFASPSGSVFLNLPQRKHDSCLVVVTGQNKIPVIKTIYFNDFIREFLNLESYKVNDTNGNNNSLADYAETFFLKLTISNLGASDSHMVYAKLTSESKWITIKTDSVQIGTLPGKSQINLSDYFKIEVADSIPDYSRANFKLLLKSNKQEKLYSIDLILHSPVIDALSYYIDDSKFGNNNHLADPGETLKLIFRIQNSGSSTTSGLFKLMNQPERVAIPEKTINTGNILPGSIIEVPVWITLSSQIMPGTILEFKTQINCMPYVKNKTFVLSSGMSRESFEYQNFNVFPWINNLSYPWIITNSQAFDGQYSARSGIISHSNESVLKMIVNLPVNDTLKFKVKVSSEYNYDLLIFKINNIQKFTLSGETDWIEKVIILPAGVNTLEWIYKKDGTVSSGSDCAWIDYLTFPRLAFIKRDLSLLKINNPVPDKEHHFENIQADAINLGSEVLNGINLAYKINKNLPVNEFFNINLNPGDTAHIQFTQKADMSYNGTYLISVYGFGNNDSYALNDTAKLAIINTAAETIREAENNLVNIIPNPFSDYIKLTINSTIGDEIQLSIYETTGRIILRKNEPILQGENSIYINTSNLASGVYIIKTSGKQFTDTRRIVKIR